MFTVDYFIQKFEAIPEDRWWTHSVTDGRGRYCAMGHCNNNNELDALQRMFSHYTAYINDGCDCRYPQPTAKQRVLAALSDEKERLTPHQLGDVKPDINPFPDLKQSVCLPLTIS